ncbi:MAG: tRNA (adenosine(37)-N6)-threonylcarbamoyltransferase complex ATPase subunit type 1 TsaE [Clostridia bacterium]|nr:tRNA (adenosine(37)-N6)-threonylcarbamoyltransferase complex ATPase subunit type 1 TsaE [Clostridia bacterium]
MAVFLSKSQEDTLAWAQEYAKTLRLGDTVLLEGEMGAGKTLVAKGIAKGLGIKEEVTSPTYAYVNAYENRLFHFDCYRVSSEQQAFQLGFADYFEAGGICLVEWSENIAGLLPEKCKRVEIIKRGESAREIRF